MASSRRPLLLMDANVLIDFCDSDRTVIPLISKHIGRVHVPMPILLEEVEQFKDFDWTELGIVGIEPSLALVTQAAQRRAGLSFHDHLCLLLAGEHRWTCVTNDGRLRRECKPKVHHGSDPRPIPQADRRRPTALQALIESGSAQTTRVITADCVLALKDV
jgi:hypothetical protein